MILRIKHSKMRMSIYPFMAFYFNLDMLEDLANTLCYLMLHKEVPSLVNKSFLFMCLAILAIFAFCRKGIDRRFIAISALSAVIYMGSIVLSPGISVIFSKSIVRGIIYVLVPIYFFSCASDLNQLFDSLKPYIYIGVLYALLQIPLQHVMTSNEDHYMEFTYNSIIPLLVSLNTLLLDSRKKNALNKAVDVLIPALLISLNLLYGARGVLLCVLVAVILWVFFSSTSKLLVRVSIITGAAAIAILSFDRVISMLQEVFPASRTVLRIAENNFINTSSSVRIRSWEYIIKHFLDSPFSIRGFLSDRIDLGQYFALQPDEIFGSYAHNIIMEQIYQFGIVIVPIMMLSLVYLFIVMSKIKHKGSDKDRIVASAIIAFGFGQLAVSSSYLIARSFGMLVGMTAYYKSNQLENR